MERKLMSPVLNALFLASEAAPLIKVGGLGDVAGSLPAALKDLPTAVDVRIALPFYDQLDLDREDLKPAASFTIAHRDGPLLAEVYQTALNGVPLYLISGPPVRAAGAVYSGNNQLDGAQFTFFSLAAMQLARSLDWPPDILHAHDWHASPAVYNLSLIRDSDEFFRRTRSLLTVHNLPYLGYGAGPELGKFGLPPAEGSPLPDWAQHLPLPLGLLSADAINTVSKGYAQEMLTPEYGAGVEDFLLTRAEDIHGILNGLDMDSWDPETDPHLPANYSLTSLNRRQENKLALLKELDLDLKLDRPLLAMINRMDYQKGVDLVPGALRALEASGWQAVILGTGDPGLEAAAANLDREDPRVRTVLRYDGALARRIYAGADLMIIPSRYEPCGLTQMIDMR